ncbi:MAG: hypothetical protein COB43_14350 [Oceanospirillales bacterium]|nr:MAG: hypothetical protein COB43_14350 [Oceanospirillales bacterium]
MKYIFLAILTLIPCIASATVLNCGTNDIKRISVQGDREGTHGHENKLIVLLSNNDSDVLCSGNNYVYMDNKNPAYTGTAVP